MIDPFTAIILASSALGANVAHNKDQNVLEGALKGAALGFTGGALGGVSGAPALPFFGGPGGAAIPVVEAGASTAAINAGTAAGATASSQTAKIAAAETAKKLAAEEAAKAAAAKSITPTFTPDAVTAIDAGRRSLLETAGVDSTLLREPLKYKGVTGIPGSETFITKPTLAQNNLGAFNPTITPPDTFVAPNIFERAGAKLLSTAKDKPLETAAFASAVGSTLSPPPPPPAGGAPFTFGSGSVQPTPTVDETIGEMPVFVPKPLFDDMMGRSPEEMMLLEEQMNARGLV
mgnify:CR=1 FL=1